MSAPNFHKVNASKFYVLDGRTFYNEDGEQLEGWQEGCTTYDDTEDEIEAIRENAGANERKGWAGYYGSWHVPTKDYRPAPYGEGVKIICQNVALVELSPACNIEIKTEIHYRPGHYEARVLDWSIFASDENGSSFDGEYEPEDVDGLVVDALDFVDWRESYWNRGLIKMQARNIEKKIRQAMERARTLAEDFCRQNCTGVYELAYMFSNGEAGYNKVA